MKRMFFGDSCLKCKEGVSFLAALILVGCQFGGVGSPEELQLNRCDKEFQCGSEAQCVVQDDASSRCERVESLPLEVIFRVVPPSGFSAAPMPVWQSEPRALAAATALTLPTHVDVRGTLRWKGMRVPAELTFVSSGPLGEERLRVSTLSEVRLGEDGSEIDFAARIATDRQFDLEVTPLATSAAEWASRLPPLRFQSLQTPATDPTAPASFLWPMTVDFPNTIDRPCGASAVRCSKAGRVVSEDGEGLSGLSVRAIERSTGRTVSSVARTDARGAFDIVLGDGQRPIDLRVSGSSSTPFASVTLPEEEWWSGDNVAVTKPVHVIYEARIESSLGVALEGAGVLFAREDDGSGTYESTATSNERGIVQMSLVPGTYRVVVVPSEPDLAVIDEREVVIDGRHTEVRGQLYRADRRALATGSLQTEDGRTLAGIAVEAVVHEASSSAARSSAAELDAAGEFSLPLDRGTYSLWARPPIATGFGWVFLRDATITDLGAQLRVDATLPTPYVVRGTVRDASGNTVLGADVRVFAREAGTSEDYVELGRGLTDETGKFQVAVSPMRQ